MLYGIPRILSPKMVSILMEMGHGDEIVLADANFPACSIAASCTSGEAIYCQGIGVPELLDAILTLMPLDYVVESPVVGMAVQSGVDAPPIHSRFKAILADHDYPAGRLTFIPRFDFYDRARRAYAVFATGESSGFANLILKKGTIRDTIRRE